VLRGVARVQREIAEARPAFRKSLVKLCGLLGCVVRDDLETDDQGRLVIASAGQAFRPRPAPRHPSNNQFGKSAERLRARSQATEPGVKQFGAAN
jgi:hypothetical protein